MITPVFAPFAGRKANALMLPMLPDLVDADSIDAAFAAYDRARPPGISDLWSKLQFKPRGDALIFADADGVPTQLIERLEERRDIPESRAKWRFGLRTEVLLRKPSNTGETA